MRFIIIFFYLFNFVSSFAPRIYYTFLLDNEGWTIEGNQRYSVEAQHIPHTFNREMSRFITGNDTIIHVNSRGDYNDKSLWYFRSPFLQAGDLSNYKYINFSLSCFSGISNSLNKIDHYIRICSNNGLCAKYNVIDAFNMTDKWTTFHVPLNKLLWSDKFNIIIKNVSYIYILGDWTQWYETIGLDNFFIR
uniref:CBM11 domain-containing protein n=1 Tax=viral metagenome TaxID=1070528 RepID=A0A6C0IRT6_9ZZZZ